MPTYFNLVFFIFFEIPNYFGGVLGQRFAPPLHPVLNLLTCGMRTMGYDIEN